MKKLNKILAYIEEAQKGDIWLMVFDDRRGKTYVLTKDEIESIYKALKEYLKK